MEIIPKPELNCWFLYYYLNLNVDLLNSLGTGATFKELSTKSLSNISIPVPPLPEQQRIVDILDRCFEAIDRARAIAEQNLKNARELFESYLHGVFEGRSEEWEERRLGEVCSFKGGGTPSTKNKNYWNGDIPWVSPKDMKSKHISFSQDYITLEAIENSSASFIPEKSILIVVRSGILSRIVPIGIATTKLTINQDLKALVPKSNLESRFLYYFLYSKMNRLLSMVTRGATVHRLTTDSLKSLKISLPRIQIQKDIVTEIQLMEERAEKLEYFHKTKITNLDELKKSILQKAFSGEL